jgi:hypothetical protein
VRAKATRAARGAVTAAGGRRRPLGGGRPNGCRTCEATARRRLEASLTGGCSWWRRQRRGAGRGRKSGGSARCRAERGRKTPLFETNRGRYCSNGPGPIQCIVLFCKYSNLASMSKYKLKTIPMSKIIETWHGARVDPSKQFLPLGPLPILNRIQVIQFGTTSTLNLPLNF